MIAVARQLRTSKDVRSDELSDVEREELRQVDPLREIDLPAEELQDSLEDPLRQVGSPQMVAVQRLGEEAGAELLRNAPEESQKPDEVANEEKEDPQVQQVEQMQEVAAVPTAPSPPSSPSPSGIPDKSGSPEDKLGEPEKTPPEKGDMPDEPAPPAPPAPKPQPPQKSEPLEASGSKDLADQYQKAPPTQKALNYKAMGKQMSDLGQQEQGQLEQSVPEYHAKLEDEAPLPRGKEPVPEQKAHVPTPPPRARVDKATTGQVPKPQIQPTARLGRFRASSGVEELRGLRDDGGSEKKKAIDQALQHVPTHDQQVETSPGPRPQVPLKGDTDPRRLAKVTDSGMEDADRARHQAHKQVLDSPGQELVKSKVMDETHHIQTLKKVPLVAPPPVGETEEYLQLGLPGDVQGKFDQMYGPEMEAHLEDAKGKIHEATDQRDQKHQDELDKADERSQELHEEAQKQQDEVVTEQRERIRKERQGTMQAQNEAIRDLHAKTDAKKRAHDKEITDRVKADEAKIHREYADADTKAKKQVAEGETKAKAEKAKKKEESKKKSWWEKAVSAVTDFVSAIAKVVTEIFDAVRKAVSAILDQVKAVANDIIDSATKFITSAISMFGDWLKAAIEEVLAKHYPKLAKALCDFVDHAVAFVNKKLTQLAEGLKKGIAALCDGITKALNAAFALWKAGVDFAMTVLKAALTGDWGAVMRKVLEAVLSLCGISPEEFYKVAGKGEDTIEKVVKNPGRFVKLGIDAMSLGFHQFSDNFMDHLKTGLVDWLTGETGDIGIKMPKELNLEGVFDIVLQVVGLSKSYLRKKAERLIGKENVERIEWVWDFVENILESSDEKGESGLAGLWTHIEDQVGDIWEEVIGGVKDWLLTRIVMKAVAKLAMMFNPIGAIVQLLMTIWNVYCWLRDNMQRIWGVVTAWVGSITDFVDGNIKPAAAKIEGALAGLVPVAISLLANLLGLKGIGKRVRKIIEGIHEKIDKAIDKFIDRIKGMFPKKKASGKEGESEARGGGDKVVVESSWEVGEVQYATTEKKREKLEKLEVHGSYKLEVVGKEVFERRYKRHGQIDTDSLNKKAKRQSVAAVANDIVGSGDSMFAIYGDSAYGHYERQGKARLANAMAEDGLKVVKFEVSGKAPQGRTPEEVGHAVAEKAKKVGRKVKEKVIDPVTQKVVKPVTDKVAKVTEPVRKKIAETWAKATAKGRELVDKATAPVVATWNKARAKIDQTVIQPMVKRAKKAGDWVKGKAEMAKAKAIALTDKIMGPATAAMNKVEQVSMRVISATVKPLQTVQGWQDKAEETVEKLKKKVKDKAEHISDAARSLADELVYDDHSRTRLKQIAAEEKARQNKKIDAKKGTKSDESESDAPESKTSPETDGKGKKQDDEKKEPAHGWDHPDARGLLMPRVHFVALGRSQTLQFELGDTPYISVTGPRPNAAEQVAYWRGHLNDLKDPTRRAEIAQQLRSAERALRSFQHMVAELDGLTADDARARHARKHVSKAMARKRDALRGPFAMAYRAFKGWDGPTASKKEEPSEGGEKKESRVKEAFKESGKEAKEKFLEKLLETPEPEEEEEGKEESIGGKEESTGTEPHE